MRRGILVLTVFIAVGCDDAVATQTADASQSEDGGADAGDADAGDASTNAGAQIAKSVPDASVADAGAGSVRATECSSHECWCNQVCDKVEAVHCPKSAPLAECKAACKTPYERCADESLLAIMCRAMLPQDAYVCDSRLGAFPEGCDAELDAFVVCKYGE